MTWWCRAGAARSAIRAPSTLLINGAQSPGQVTLTATHPYAAGSYANETVTKQLVSTATPVAIISGWGMVSPSRLAKWSDEIAQDTGLPGGGTAPWICDSEGDYCVESYDQSSADFTREKLAAEWLAEITRMMKLQTWIAGARVEHQHSIGVVDWRNDINGYVDPSYQPPYTNAPDYFGVADEFTDLNVDSVVSVTSLTNSAPQVAKLSRAIALASATLEGSVLETMEDLPDSASRQLGGSEAGGNDPGRRQSPPPIPRIRASPATTPGRSSTTLGRPVRHVRASISSRVRPRAAMPRRSRSWLRLPAYMPTAARPRMRSPPILLSPASS